MLYIKTSEKIVGKELNAIFAIEEKAKTLYYLSYRKGKSELG